MRRPAVLPCCLLLLAGAQLLHPHPCVIRNPDRSLAGTLKLPPCHRRPLPPPPLPSQPPPATPAAGPMLCSEMHPFPTHLQEPWRRPRNVCRIQCTRLTLNMIPASPAGWT